MKETLVIEAKPRAARGSRAAGRLRRAGQVPGIVYGQGREPLAVTLSAHDFERLIHHHQGEHLIMDLVVEGDTRKVLLQEVQRDPMTDRLLHVDFHEISLTEKLRVEVQIALVGTPIGVSQQGGVLDHLLRQVEIECLPLDIPEQITVDVSGLAVGQHLSVKDIQLDPAKYTIITAPDIAIAAVFLPKAEEAVAAEAAPGEPEVITEKKAEEAPTAEAKEEKKEKKEEEKKK